MPQYVTLDQLNRLDGAIWFILIWMNAGIAQSKNRSTLLWIILSLFLGPFATIILVLFIRRRPLDSR